VRHRQGHTLARRAGVRVTAVEIGASMAEVAREVLAGQPVEIHVARFEEWEPREGARFDLAVCAQAYHWMDPERANPKIARLLAPGAKLSCFWNYDEDRVPWLDVIYDEHAAELGFSGAMAHVDDRIEEQRARIEEGGALRTIEVRRYPITMRKRAADYVRLIDTYSDHRTLPDETRTKLYGAVAAAIEARGGVLERPVIAFNVIARAR
jgi:SAM-dependent methyltransferase